MKVLGLKQVSNMNLGKEAKEFIRKQNLPRLSADSFEKMNPGVHTPEEKNLIEEDIQRLKKAIEKK